MNYYLFDRPTYERLYNCSMLPIAEWEKRKHPNPMGPVYMIMAFIYQILYIPFLIIMLRKQFFQHSCYKLMFLMGLIDVCATIIGGTLMGIFLIRGDYYCSNPDFLFIVSCFTATFWTAGCAAGLILIINRALNLACKGLEMFMFDGYRTYVWYIITILYGGYCCMFTKPFLINARMDSLFNNPFVGMDDIKSDNNEYLNVFVFYHNFGTAIVFPVLYVLLCVILVIKTRGGHSSVSSIQKQMIIQSIFISLFMVSAALTFDYMQLFTVGDVYMIYAHLSWQACHGASVFTYIIINKSMRHEAIDMFKRFLGARPARIDPSNPISHHINPTWLREKGRVPDSQTHGNTTQTGHPSQPEPDV